MDNEILVDYAYPAMMAERSLKDMHNAMLDRKFETAYSYALKALVEVKLVMNAIYHAIEVEQK
jgi:hypothetical protein